MRERCEGCELYRVSDPHNIGSGKPYVSCSRGDNPETCGLSKPDKVNQPAGTEYYGGEIDIRIEMARRQERMKVLEEIEYMFSDNDGTVTFIKRRDNKAGVEDCKLIVADEWQAFREKARLRLEAFSPPT